MKSFKKFNYKSLDDLEIDISNMGLDLPTSEDLSSLAMPFIFSAKAVPNRLTINPMEGCDSEDDGSPSDLVFRRYARFSEGGAGMLWFEACAVTDEGRANPRQLFINEGNVYIFKQIIDNIKKTSPKAYNILQLTHSGRYSYKKHIIAAENPYLDKFFKTSFEVISDEKLKELEDAFVKAAELAQKAGFDAVDIKASHRYLCNELLSSFTRDGDYGKSFENRTKFLLNVVGKIKDKLKIDIVVRLNAYDEIPYPYGFGVDASDLSIPDFNEPIQLVKLLKAAGVCLVNITAGNPYYNPHINRPYNMGTYTPKNHPLFNVYKLLNAARVIKDKNPDMPIVASGFSWLKKYGANVGAGCIEKGWFDFCGFGRQAFAYPSFANDILTKGEMDNAKCCAACSKCTIIMRDGGRTGCPIYDRELYFDIYKNGRMGKPDFEAGELKEHI